jgi:hypothetical protein
LSQIEALLLTGVVISGIEIVRSLRTEEHVGGLSDIEDVDFPALL